MTASLEQIMMNQFRVAKMIHSITLVYSYMDTLNFYRSNLFIKTTNLAFSAV